MQHPGDPTIAEIIAFFDARIAKLTREKAAIKKDRDKYLEALDELCANAEPVCDCLEMGKTLKSPNTLKSFRKALAAGWAAIPVEDGAA